MLCSYHAGRHTKFRDSVRLSSGFIESDVCALNVLWDESLTKQANLCQNHYLW